MSKSISCPRCGAANEAGRYHCSSCKFNLSVKYTPQPGDPKPSEAVNDTADVASDRGDQQRGSISGPVISREAEALGIPREERHRIASVLLTRYRNAYKQADSIIKSGTALKTIGWVIAVLIVLGGIMTKNSQVVAGSIVVALGIGSSFNSMGIGTAAKGQLMLASLDTAVNTSPFLDDTQKIQILTHV